jgi:hypothetical protein
MWIGQGKLTNPGNCRFVKRTLKIMIQFLVDLKVQYTHCDKSRPDRTFAKFLSQKTVGYEPQTR